MRRLLPFGSLFLLIPLLGGCPTTAASKAEPPPSASAAWAADDARWGWLGFETVRPGRSIPMLPVPGRVAPLETATWALQAPIAGRVDAAEVRIGQEVKRGDRLVLVRSAALADLHRERTLARQTLDLKQAEARHARTLSQAHAIAERDLLATEQALKAAQVDLQTITNKLAALDVDLIGESQYWLKAPRDGVVVQAEVTPGQEVSPDAPALVVMADLQQVVVWAQMLEADVGDIRSGMEAEVRAMGRVDEPVPARVESVSQTVDPDLHTVGVRLVTRQGASWLRPNGYVQVVFQQPGAQALIVPTQAVVTDDLQSVVFVKAPDGRLIRRPVVVGRQTNEQTEILQGLQPDETIVTKGAILLLNEVEP